MSLRLRRLSVAATALTLFLGYVVAAVALSGPASAHGTVTVAVQGKGTVTGTGINCTESGGPDCSQFYADDEECDVGPHPTCFDVPPTVEFVAAAAAGFTFLSFTGCSSVSGQTCTLDVTSSTTVVAHFADTTVPAVSLTSPASGAKVAGSVNLAATASDNVGVQQVSFRVRGVLVGSGDSSPPYATSFDTTTVPDGTATVSATASDTSGNESVNSASITIDNTAPTVSVTGPDGQTFGPGSTQTWNLVASDATTGPPSVQCSVVATGSTNSFGSCSGGPTSHSVSGLPEGAYTFAVRAADGTGNIADVTRSFTIDATAPDTSITGGPASGGSLNGHAVSFGVGATEAGSTIGCRLYASGTTAPLFAPCTTATSFAASGLGDGSYVFEARATDAVGNVDATPATRTFTIDNAAPDTQVTTGPAEASVVTSRSVIFGIASEAGSTVACRLYRSGTTAPGFAACTTATSFTASGLDDGSYVFEARATDVAGNTDASPVNRTFTVDATAPTVTIAKQPKRTVKTSKKKVKVSFGFAVNDPGATFRCSLDGAAYAACPAAATFTIKVGKHVLDVVAVDSAGNVSPTRAIAWKVKRVRKHP